MKSKIISIAYLLFALAGIWFLVKLWMPSGYVLGGHDSGLALNAKDFLLTRLNAWNDKINFGQDNSPYFGSLVLHSIDYLLSIVGGTLYSGNQVAVFFWISVLFVSAFFFSSTIESVTGKYFKFIFPVFVTFNFYIFQSIFILERAKYELCCVSLIFLAFAFKVIKNERSVIKYSIIFSVLLSIFNGGSWLGFPLYGGFLVSGLVVYISVLFHSLKKRKFDVLGRLSLFYLFNSILFLLFNAYSILPYFATFISSAYGQVVDKGIIQSGMEWLNYISRGSSFLNLFKLQGIPDWYLTEFLPAPQHAYSSIYMTSSVLIFVSTIFPIIALFSLPLAKKKEEKYLVAFALFLLIISMFFTAGTNSPLGFIYNFFYRNIPGFSIFRSPYFKFGYAYIFSFSFLLAFSSSKLVEFVTERLRKIITKPNFLGGIGAVVVILIIILGWFSCHYIIFSPRKLFNWQEDKSTVFQIPSHISEFNDWINNQKEFESRILLLPPLDNTWMTDYYSWGYWSLSTLFSVASPKLSIVVNDRNLLEDERSWVNEVYSLMKKRDFASFERLASRLNIGYILLRNDFVLEDSTEYLDLLVQMKLEGRLKLVKNFGDWILYRLINIREKPVIFASYDFAKISNNYFYFPRELSDTEYSKYLWLKFEEIKPNSDLDILTKKEFYNIPCASCQIENLGKYAGIPPVRILPNSPLYQIKRNSQQKLIKEAQDDEYRLNLYLEFILTKLSEIRSMQSLDIDKQIILSGMKDMSSYLDQVNYLLENSIEKRNDFYIASKIYEYLNPVQRYFRDFVSAAGFQFEKEDVKDLAIKILWDINLLKKYFSPLISQSEIWNYEKIYRLGSLEDGTYKLLIDSESLPVDDNGLIMKPQKLITKLGQEVTITYKNSSRWLESEYFEKNSNVEELNFTFPSLPNLFSSKGMQLLDFPLGQKGCLVGNISFFNKHKMYRIKLQSSAGRKNIRLYVNEKKSEENSFLHGDIVTDVFLANPTSSFEYIYDPQSSAENPSIYLCENDASFSATETIEVYEIFFPIIFAEKSVSDKSFNMPNISFEEKKPLRFNISITEGSDPFVLVFNQRFNSLWKLSDSNGKSISPHFSVDGYANGWLLGGKENYYLNLEYYPQKLFEYGIVISIFSLIISMIIYIFVNTKNKR